MLSRVFMFCAIPLAATACSSPEEFEQAATGEQAAASSASSSSSTSVSTSRDGNGSSSSSSSSSSANGGMAFAESNDLYEFEYSWPSAAGAIPGLRRTLDAMMTSEKALLDSNAREEREMAQQGSNDFRPHSASWEWQVAADTPRFLSLTAGVATYMGGAHGNYGKDVLVWDKQRDLGIEGLALFASPAVLDRAVSARWCAELNRQREERRGMTVDPATPFGKCPSVTELAVIPGSSNGDTFDRIGLYAAPYIAGAYAEGDYEVTLPVDAAIMRAVKPQYRSAFSLKE